MNSAHQNGRVDIMGPPRNQFELFDNPGVSYNDTSDYKDALNGNWDDNMLSKVFFCKGNIIIIQNGIRGGVYALSNGRYDVGPQDETNLKIIMRSIFLQNASNLPHHITEQVNALNKLVLNYSIPNVFNEAEAYIKYKNDVSTLAVPLKRPVYTNNKGDKVLELKPFM